MTVAPPAPAHAGTLGPDDPLTVSWANAALGRLYSLGLTKLCDWLMEPGCGERLEDAGVEAILREVLALTPFQLGYDVPRGERGPAARYRQRQATRAWLLLRWCTDPMYCAGDTTLDPDWR